ncbi:hypothetical protein T01_6412 [Trichinella spiralis]|uniref:Uncharacterized protein n=1 Tax=Trichinella spiralis TaxID=6334 RepID=A0A0V1B9H5_TRISP|nr:hypothetical protein T01_6412 [Trichinella spiralis]
MDFERSVVLLVQKQFPSAAFEVTTLLGMKITNHNSSRWLRSFCEPGRSIAVVCGRDIYVIHRLVVKQQNSDALSRRACRHCGVGDSCYCCEYTSPSIKL